MHDGPRCPRAGRVPVRYGATMSSLLDDVLAALAAHQPLDSAEAASIEAFTQHVADVIARGADPFDQATDPVHITGSAIVVGSRGTVLLHHRRLDMWLQPGGHSTSLAITSLMQQQKVIIDSVWNCHRPFQCYRERQHSSVESTLKA